MPRDTRDYLLRHKQQAVNDIDRALERIQVMRDIYGDIKPQHGEYLEKVQFALIQVKDLLDLFRDRFM